MWRRLKALIVKELLAVLRDPRSRMVLIGPPLIQLFVLSYAATLDISNIDVAVLNRDAGRWSTELLQRLDGAPAFRSIRPLSRIEDIRDAIDNRRAVAVLHFDTSFSRDVAAGRPASVQVILDGRRSNASQIVLGYLTAIASDLSRDITVAQAGPNFPAEAAQSPLAVRHWFNPNLTYIWFTVPGLIGMLALLVSLVVTGQSVARERELGTFDQLMVSPLRTSEILVGKLVPPLIIGMAQASAFILVTIFFFEVPLRGSLLLLYIGIIFFLASAVGVGLFISSLAQTQQQAFLGTFLFASPAILLSGFATPIENMPGWLQTVTLINPLRHVMVILRGVFLRGMPSADVAANIVPLILIAIVTLTVAGWLFRRTMQ
jgi:ABC-2 type transport system permease protein